MPAASRATRATAAVGSTLALEPPNIQAVNRSVVLVFNGLVYSPVNLAYRTTIVTCVEAELSSVLGSEM